MSWLCNHRQVLRSLFCPSLIVWVWASTLAGVLSNFIIHLLFVYSCVHTTVHVECKRELDSLLPFCGSLGLNSGLGSKMLGSKGLDDWARRFVCLFEGFGHLCSYFLRLTFWMLNCWFQRWACFSFQSKLQTFFQEGKAVLSVLFRRWMDLLPFPSMLVFFSFVSRIEVFIFLCSHSC